MSLQAMLDGLEQPKTSVGRAAIFALRKDASALCSLVQRLSALYVVALTRMHRLEQARHSATIEMARAMQTWASCISRHDDGLANESRVKSDRCAGKALAIFPRSTAQSARVAKIAHALRYAQLALAEVSRG
jgi:hypothetical protein